jgi:VIT1/CCC1 family predicted Fe2+/Mn2+ transporter
MVNRARPAGYGPSSVGDSPKEISTQKGGMIGGFLGIFVAVVVDGGGAVSTLFFSLLVFTLVGTIVGVIVGASLENKE